MTLADSGNTWQNHLVRLAFLVIFVGTLVILVFIFLVFFNSDAQNPGAVATPLLIGCLVGVLVLITGLAIEREKVQKRLPRVRGKQVVVAFLAVVISFGVKSFMFGLGIFMVMIMGVFLFRSFRTRLQGVAVCSALICIVIAEAIRRSGGYDSGGIARLVLNVYVFSAFFLPGLLVISTMKRLPRATSASCIGFAILTMHSAAVLCAGMTTILDNTFNGGGGSGTLRDEYCIKSSISSPIGFLVQHFQESMFPHYEYGWFTTTMTTTTATFTTLFDCNLLLGQEVVDDDVENSTNDTDGVGTGVARWRPYTGNLEGIDLSHCVVTQLIVDIDPNSTSTITTSTTSTSSTTTTLTTTTTTTTSSTSTSTSSTSTSTTSTTRSTTTTSTTSSTTTLNETEAMCYANSDCLNVDTEETFCEGPTSKDNSYSGCSMCRFHQQRGGCNRSLLFDNQTVQRHRCFDRCEAPQGWMVNDPAWSYSGKGAVGEWVSSMTEGDSTGTFTPGDLLSGRAWVSAEGMTMNQWIKFDLVYPRLVSEVRVRGRQDMHRSMNPLQMRWESGDGLNSAKWDVQATLVGTTDCEWVYGKLDKPFESRWWRLVIENNWGGEKVHLYGFDIKAKKADPPYLKVAKGEYCPLVDGRSTDITDETVCRLAAASLGDTYGHAWAGAAEHRNCFFASDDRLKVFFNKAQQSAPSPNKDFASVCYRVPPDGFVDNCVPGTSATEVSNAGAWAMAIYFLAAVWVIGASFAYVFFVSAHLVHKVHPEPDHHGKDSSNEIDAPSAQQEALKKHHGKCKEKCKKFCKFMVRSLETIIGCVVFVVSGIALVIIGITKLPKERPECAKEPTWSLASEPSDRFATVWCEQGAIASVGLAAIAFCCFLLTFSMQLVIVKKYRLEKRLLEAKKHLQAQREKARSRDGNLEEGPDYGEGFRIQKMAPKEQCPFPVFQDYEGRVFDC